MATISFKDGSEWALKVSRLGDQADEVSKMAIYPAADLVTDTMKRNLQGLPEDRFRLLHKGEQFHGVPPCQKADLVASLGITPMRQDMDGNWNVKIGFDGYGSYPTRKYPKGVPNQMLARSVESGSSVRRKTPFVRPAVNSCKDAALQKMAQVIDQECERLMKG